MPNTPRPKVIVTRRLPQAVETRMAELFDVELNLTDTPFSQAQLADAARRCDVLVPTVTDHLDATVFDAGRDGGKLKLCANFGVGVDHLDLHAARGAKVTVTNTPGVFTDDTADLTMALILNVPRRLGEGHRAMRNGEWSGWSPTGMLGHRIGGKTLGIIGYGNIGSQLSTLAEAMGMRVIYFDVMDKLRHGNTEPVESLNELLRVADVVSLHVPENTSTFNMMGAEQFAQMKKGAHFINNARGTVVDLDALAAALKSGHLAGAAVDVFPVEPASNSEKFVTPIQGLPNVIITPHIGGSTEEAQERIGAEVARKLVEYSDSGSTVGAVNFPQVQLPSRAQGTRFIHVHKNVPGVMNRLNQVFSRHGVNIAAQYLQTEGDLGYVVMEADGVGGDAEAVLEEM
jgi:D-3-phosphoglycerate dehydrogenase